MTKNTALLGKSVTNAADLYRLVDPTMLKVNPENERDYEDPSEDMDSLYQSMKSEGQKTPIQVYADGVVHDGNRRLTVINRLLNEGVKFGQVRVLVVPRPKNKVERIFSRLNTNEARQFSPLAQARAFAELRAEGLSNSDIAKRTPFTGMHIGNMLTLADASQSLKDAVRDGQVSSTLAVETIRKHGEQAVFDAIQLALSEGKEKATQRHVDSVTADIPDVEVIETDEAETTGEATGVIIVGEVEVPVEAVEATGETVVGEVEVPVEATGDVPTKTDTDVEAKAETEAEADVFKFTMVAGKSMIQSFLPFAQKFLGGKMTAKDFKAELEAFVTEASNYGLTGNTDK